MTDSFEAVVVGGGIVGASTAYHLAEAGVDTLLVDADHEGRATDAGAGIVSPATSSRRADDDWFRLAAPAADYYPDLVSKVEAGGATDHGYRASDLLSLAIDEADDEAFQADLDRIRDRTDDGRLDETEFEELDASEAEARCPVLDAPHRVFVARGAAQVDGSQFTRALRRAGHGSGLSSREAMVEELVVENGAITGVVADGEYIDCEAVVVAGGAWSTSFGADLGVEIPVAPKRGQIVHLDVGATTPPTDDWPILGGYRGYYLVPWADGHVAAGATREEGSGFDPRATAAGVREVLGEALTLAPGLADATFSEVRVGLRPSTEDGLPVLGEVPSVEGAYLATGTGPTGLTIGPYSGKLVAEVVRGQEPAVDLDAFAVERF
jgi:D-amino-acid dehydrogenase